MSVKIVEADSVADYLQKYYKQDRLKDIDSISGEGTLLRFYEIDFECFGFICTSHHDNITGEFIAWPKYEEKTQEQLDKMYRLREEFQPSKTKKEDKVKASISPNLDIFR